MRNGSTREDRQRRGAAACIAAGFAVALFLCATVAAVSPATLGIGSARLSFARIVSSSEFSFNPVSWLPQRRDTKRQIETAVLDASKRYAVPKELIWSVIAVESNFNPSAQSRVGAIGLMQLMPKTAAYMKVNDPWDLYENVHGGTRYLRYLLDKFDGNTSLALAAYNSGPGTVRRFGGIPPYRETQGYVRKVLTRYEQERNKSLSL